jgi:L-rhamnose-H+ transport protein
MHGDLVLGVVITGLSGLIMGTSPWPLKLMRRFRYEHFALISMVFALVILPWLITLTSCPHPWAAIATLPPALLWKANLFSLAWGIAQVLALLCFLRIGVSLTYGILCGVGAGVGVVTPMVFKASGQFAQAADLTSATGGTVLVGLAVLWLGVFLASRAGFGRERQQAAQAPETSGTPSPTGSGRFAVGLAMVVTAGVLSAGWGFAFAFSQGPIIEAMQQQGASDVAASIAVWALALCGAALVNTLYPLWLLFRNSSWSVLWSHPLEFVLALVYGLLFFVPSVLLGQGMLRLGPLGASVGFGLVQGTLILGGQVLGFLSGEWRGVSGAPRRTIYAAIVVLILAMGILALANAMAPQTATSQIRHPSVCSSSESTALLALAHKQFADCPDYRTARMGLSPGQTPNICWSYS